MADMGVRISVFWHHYGVLKNDNSIYWEKYAKIRGTMKASAPTRAKISNLSHYPFFKKDEMGVVCMVERWGTKWLSVNGAMARENATWL